MSVSAWFRMKKDSLDNHAEFFSYSGKNINDLIKMLIFMRRHVAGADHFHPGGNAGADESIHKNAGFK